MIVFIIIYLISFNISAKYCMLFCIQAWKHNSLTPARKLHFLSMSLLVVLVSSGVCFPYCKQSGATYHFGFALLLSLFFWSSLTAGHASPRGLGDWTVGARLSRWMDMWQPALLIIVSVSHPDDLRIQLVCICVRGWFWMECNTMCFQNPGIIEKGHPPPAHPPCPF